MGVGDRVAIVGAELPPLRRALPGRAGRRAWRSSRSTSATPTPSCATRSRTRGARCCSPTASIDGLPTCVEHVIDLDEGYEKLLADAPIRPTSRTTCPTTTLAGLFYTGGTTGAVEGRDAHASQPRSPTRCTSRPSAPFRPETCWLDRRARCSTPPARSPCCRPCGTAAVRSCCRPSTRRSRSTSSSATASPARCSCRRCSRRSTRSSWLARATSSACARSATAARRSPPRRCAAPTTPSPTPSCSTSTAPPRPRRSPRRCRDEERCLDAPRARSCGQPAVGVEVAVVGADGARGAASARSARS